MLQLHKPLTNADEWRDARKEGLEGKRKGNWMEIRVTQRRSEQTRFRGNEGRNWIDLEIAGDKIY